MTLQQMVRGFRMAACILSGLVAWAVPALSETGLAVADGMKVTIEYTLMLPDKTVKDSNVGQAPFAYTQGAHEIVPGLEKSMLGLKAGDKKRIDVQAAQGYGTYDAKAKISVDKTKVPAGIKAGQLLRSADGRPVVVEKVEDKTVVLDLNHPLAGKDLVFEVKVLNVEKPAPTQTNKPAGGK
ncbi:MAG: peptidylprolyl isomerase [Nitrospiraceae bacterium]